ncbi:TPA: tail fiber domain-containing protein [Klebsiella quasipneumoniae]|nr:tail fiber domain-containing protein [Klebsiella quasipneumoniae]
MPFYLTRDPVPSADMRNVFDNAQNLDLALNDLTSSLWTDRLGRSRMSWFGLESAFSVKLSDFESRFTSQIVEQEATFDASQADKENRFQHFLVSSGYVFLGDYEDGPFQFSARNQYIRYDNQYYRLNAATDVGFTTTGTDATSFANDVSHFVLMDGDALRQNLGSSEGLKLVGQCASIAALRAITLESVGQQVFVKEHTSGQGAGGGIFYCHSLTNPSSLQDDDGFQIINDFGQVIRRKDRTILSAEMFGYIPDFDGTTQTGTDNSQPLKNAIKAALQFKWPIVHLPGGPALIDVTSGPINLGGDGYSGFRGVKLVGQGQQSTYIFFRGVSGSVGFLNLGGSGTTSQKSIHGMTIYPTDDSVRLVHMYQLQGACMSHNSELYINGGLSNIRLLNAFAAGVFTEFNTFTNCRLQGGISNILFEVNGGDNSFHGNSFVNVQNQILAGSSYGSGVRVLGTTKPAYLYNQTWDMKFFGGTNCRAFTLTNCNTDNISGNLTFEGNIICETTDSSSFEFKGNLAGISSLSFTVATPTSVKAANFVFNNTLDNFSSFTNATLSSYSPRLYYPELADATDNGVSASLWRVRNTIGDGVLFNALASSPGWYFTTTAVQSRIQSASPKYFFSPDGNNITAYSSTVFLNPSNSSYGIQLSSAEARLAPRTDNVMSCGSSGYRWTQVFAANSTISTSDKRKKTNIRQISPAEIRAFYEIAMLNSVWQWLDKYQTEGDDARLHSGPTVQDAIEIMDKYGLDWTMYSCFCHTLQDAVPAVVESWEDEYRTIPAKPAIYEEDGVTIRQEAEEERVELVREAGSRVIKEAEPAVDEYAFRKEELLFWITRATIAKQQEILERLDALER